MFSLELSERNQLIVYTNCCSIPTPSLYIVFKEQVNAKTVQSHNSSHTDTILHVHSSSERHYTYNNSSICACKWLE